MSQGVINNNNNNDNTNNVNNNNHRMSMIKGCTKINNPGMYHAYFHPNSVTNEPNVGDIVIQIGNVVA